MSIELPPGYAWRHAQQINLSDKPAAPMTPVGFVICTVISGEDIANAFETLRVACMDHFGTLMESHQLYYKRMVQHIHGDPHFDPSLRWVYLLGVRREQRRQGLGLALLLYTLNEMYRRGIGRAGLSVDTQSLTGANRLYAIAGMYLK